MTQRKTQRVPVKEAFAQARAATGQADDPPVEKFNSKQAELPGTGSNPEIPKPVRNGKMMAHFVRVILHRTRDDEALISYEVSFPLTPEHEDLLPIQVQAAWKALKRGNIKRIDVDGIAPQTVAIAQVPDDKDDLTIIAASITHARLSIVKEKGTGKAKEVVRYSFRIETERMSEVNRFALAHDGETVWLSAKETQASLLD